MKIAYTATATATGGRNGKIISSDLVLDLEVKMPKELGGPGGAYTNPEQLFAGGYAACFDNALIYHIRSSKIQTGETAVRAHVSVAIDENHGYNLVITLDVNIPGVDQGTAESLVAKAHEGCPYSKAIKGNVDVKLNVTTVDAEKF